MVDKGNLRPSQPAAPSQALPLNSSAVIDVGDKLIQHEERTDVNQAQRIAEASKWTNINNVDRQAVPHFNNTVSK